MRLLHVFAGPFPTVQGTQVLVGQTCELLSRFGHDVHLLCYAHATREPDVSFTIHRIADWPRFHRDRSGPSTRKVVLDLLLARQCAHLIGRLRPHIVHAHHYEALVAAWLANPLGKTPIVFHAHALMAPELPTYGPQRLRWPAAWLGAVMDTSLPRLAHAAVAVSPYVRDQIEKTGYRKDKLYLLRPPAEITSPPRHPPNPGHYIRAVYMGNLDKYQGLDHLLRGLAILDTNTRELLKVDVITDSDPSDFLAEVRSRGLEDLVEAHPHGDPQGALTRLWEAHIALVPRVLAGGAPIKLVNALAAGRPTMVHTTTDPGLVHNRDVWAVDMTQPQAVAAGLRVLTRDSALRSRLSVGAVSAAQRLFSEEKYINDLNRLYQIMRGR
ncbi:MAG: glycosyltransferase [Myxococcota bacterium]|nr:glycosyltransferase [Myxococcota bacterium]